ncbi:hypothetical protein WH297_25190 [Ochrobactrum vermis]|uniref:Transposase n=1 Tax=Ochrobactrum vermis TaxID=1827297 RepID=A0ABU8PL74_9HYPH
MSNPPVINSDRLHSHRVERLIEGISELEQMSDPQGPIHEPRRKYSRTNIFDRLLEERQPSPGSGMVRSPGVINLHIAQCAAERLTGIRI